MLRKECRRKRKPCNAEKYDQVERNEPIIVLADQCEQPVVVEPHDTDRHEARQKCEVRWPEGYQNASKGPARGFGRHVDAEDQQGDAIANTPSLKASTRA